MEEKVQAPPRKAKKAPVQAIPRPANPMARGALLGAITGFNKTALKKSKTNPPDDERPPPKRDPSKPLSMMEEMKLQAAKRKAKKAKKSKK